MVDCLVSGLREKVMDKPIGKETESWKFRLQKGWTVQLYLVSIVYRLPELINYLVIQCFNGTETLSQYPTGLVSWATESQLTLYLYQAKLTQEYSPSPTFEGGFDEMAQQAVSDAQHEDQNLGLKHPYKSWVQSHVFIIWLL